MATYNSQYEVVFVQVESTYGTIPNSSGTGTVANADAVAVMGSGGCVLSLNANRITPNIKRTSLSARQSVKGRSSGTVTMRVPMAGSGSAGTAPDCNELLQAAFGKAPTVNAGVSVVYGLEDASPSLTVYRYRASGVCEIAAGWVIESVRFIPGDESTIEFSGPCKQIIYSTHFSSYTTAEKCGLTSIPTQPASPVYNGDAVSAQFGTATIDGSTYTPRSISFDFGMGRSVVQNSLFSGSMPTTPGQGVRNIGVTFSLDDSDVAALTTLKSKILAGTAFDVTIAVGATAGNIWTFFLNDLQGGAPTLDDGDLVWGLSFTGRATDNTTAGKGEATLTLT